MSKEQAARDMASKEMQAQGKRAYRALKADNAQHTREKYKISYDGEGLLMGGVVLLKQDPRPDKQARVLWEHREKRFGDIPGASEILASVAKVLEPGNAKL